MNKRLEQILGVQYPLICGAMYPCSNLELITAAAKSGVMAVIQPLSLTYVNGLDFKKAIQKIKSETPNPLGLNVLVEASSKIYMDRMRKYVDQALEEGVRFFITALGNPSWVVKRVESLGGVVFHDVTERRWALKALDAGIKGLICVNNRAGGHAGDRIPFELYDDLKDLGVPLVCAGGVGGPKSLKEMFKIGYDGVQMGTRFIASKECNAPEAYKRAILEASSQNIVLTEKITGVPVSVIRNALVDRLGTKASGLAKWMLKNPRFKHWMRLCYSIKSFRGLKRSIQKPLSHQDYWQAGKSVDEIESIDSVSEIVKKLAFAMEWNSSK